MPTIGTLVDVRYLYAFREGCLFQPVYLKRRNDIDIKDCTTAQLKYSADEDDE